MIVEIIGPDLPVRLSAKGDLHVHRAGCSDLGRVRYAGERIDVSSRAEIMAHLSGEIEATGATVFVAPCLNELR